MASRQTSGAAIVGSLALGPLWVFLDDLPSQVRPGEPPVRQLIAWWWTAFHVVGACLVSLVFPLWGAVWGSAAALVLARRVCASGQTPMGLPIRSVVAEVLALPRRAWIAPTVVLANAALLILMPLPSVLGDLQGIFGTVTAPVVIGVTCWAGWTFQARNLRSLRAHGRWSGPLGVVLNVAPTVMRDQTWITERADGTVIVDPLPPAAAAHIAPANRAALDVRIAQVLPGMMLDPLSDTTRAAFIPVDAETAARRSALAGSGGMIAGEIAPAENETSGWQQYPTAVQSSPASIVVTAEELR